MIGVSVIRVGLFDLKGLERHASAVKVQSLILGPWRISPNLNARRAPDSGMSRGNLNVFVKIAENWGRTPKGVRKGLIAYGAAVTAHYTWAAYSHGAAALAKHRSEYTITTPTGEAKAIERACSEVSFLDSLVLPYALVRDVMPRIVRLANSKN